jgi:outer membrane protein
MLTPFKKNLLSLILIASIPALAQGQTTTQTPAKTTWTLQECVDYGLQNNLNIKQAALNTDISRLTVQQSKNNLLPTVNGNTNYSFNFGLSQDPTTGVLVNQQSRSNNISINTSVPLFSGFQLRNTIKQNQLNYEANVADTERAKNDIILNIVSAYLQVILSEELLQTSQLQLGTTQQQLERTQKLFRAGSVAESNVFELNSQLASDEVNIVNAQNQKDIARLNLMQLLNLQEVPAFEVVRPEIKDPTEQPLTFDANSVFEVAQSRMPEIKGAEMRVQSALTGIALSKGNYYPQLSVGAQINTRFVNFRKDRIIGLGEETTIVERVGFLNGDESQPVTRTVKFTPPIIEDYTYLTQLKDNRGEGIFISLNVPIFNGFSARNSVQRSEINHRNAILNTEIVRNQLRATIQQSFADASAAQKTFAATKRQLAALELTFRNAEIRFNNGLLNPTEFNVARNNFIRAQSDLIRAKYEYTFRLKVLDFYQSKPITL